MSVRRPYIIGLSVPGYLHQKSGQPCQDDCAYCIHDDKYCFIAVADGLGSASLSNIGSHLAVQCAISVALDLILSEPSSLPLIPLKMIESARKGLIERAEEDNIDISDLATTLIVSAFDRENLYCAQIGDGAIVVQSEGQLHLVSYPSHSEYANEVIPITTDDYVDYIATNHISCKIDCLAVFTDGCQRASLKKTPYGYVPFEGFFKPVFSFSSSIEDIRQANKEIEAFLLSEKMSEHSEDDKTIVIAVM